MTSEDIPSFTDHETRALIYIYEVEKHQKNEDEDPPTISELSELTDWSSKYFTRAWKRLQPKNLVDRRVDGKNTRLSLTDKGVKVAEKFLEINAVMDK